MPVLSYQEAGERLARGDFPHLLLLHGEEFLARELIWRLRARLEAQGESLDWLEWEGEAGERELAAALATPSFGHTRRLVVAGDPPLSVIARYLEASNPSLVLVLLFKTKIKPAEQVYRIGEEKGWVVECAPLRGKELLRWMQEEARSRGKELPPAAGEYLRFLCGDNLAQIRQEIEKASLFLGPGRRAITVAVLEKVGSRTAGRSVFELVDSLAERKAEAAREVLADLLGQGHPPALLVSLLSRHFLQLLEAACLQKEGVPPSRIPEVMEIHPYAAKKLLKQANYYRIEEIEEILASLLLLDRAIKEGRGAPRLLLEAGLGEICMKKPLALGRKR
ncbi:MAG: DNA polymerase III subunit delta [Firmicutes bacterium]|nr:DNA polymerase III subunit delta [Bacillota bacterium]